MTPPRPPHPSHPGSEPEDTPIPAVHLEAVERELREFLHLEARERASGFTKEAIKDSVHNLQTALMDHVAEDKKNHAAIEKRLFSHSQRISHLESRADAAAEEPKADITSSHSVVEIKAKATEWEDRYKRKIQRDEMAAIAAKAIERAEAQGFAGWMQRHGWKGAIAGGLIALQALLHWADKLLSGAK
jgi:hypothetical protein